MVLFTLYPNIWVGVHSMFQGRHNKLYKYKVKLQLMKIQALCNINVWFLKVYFVLNTGQFATKLLKKKRELGETC